MVRSKKPEEITVVRAKVSVTIDTELVQWVDEQVKARRFRNRSHAFEWALAHVVEEEKRSGRHSPGRS